MGLAAPPKFTASLSVGRTIADMYANKDDNILKVPNGVKGHVDAAFAHTIFKASEKAVGMKPKGPDPLKAMGAMSSVTIKQEYRYRALDEAFEEAFGWLPTLGQGVAQLAEQILGLAAGMKNGDKILGLAAGLADVAD